MKILKSISLFCFIMLMISCDDKQSLQEYYVDNQGNSEFVAIDVPTSMFANTESLSNDQKMTLETVKKINILAIPQKSENQDKIELEKTAISNILKQYKKYQF